MSRQTQKQIPFRLCEVSNEMKCIMIKLLTWSYSVTLYNHQSVVQNICILYS